MKNNFIFILGLLILVATIWVVTSIGLKVEYERILENEAFIREFIPYLIFKPFI